MEGNARAARKAGAWKGKARGIVRETLESALGVSQGVPAHLAVPAFTALFDFLIGLRHAARWAELLVGLAVFVALLASYGLETTTK